MWGDEEAIRNEVEQRALGEALTEIIKSGTWSGEPEDWSPWVKL